MGWGRGTELTGPPLPAAFPPSTATGTLSIEILEVNDHAPALALPPTSSLCSEPDQGPGLLLGATDEDLPPHGAPFHFQLSPRVPELSRNWSLSQINGALPDPHQPRDLGGGQRARDTTVGGVGLFSIPSGRRGD
jgi:cadherin 15 (M-cadherin)